MSKLNEKLEKWKRMQKGVAVTLTSEEGAYGNALLKDWDDEILILQFLHSGNEFVVKRSAVGSMVAYPKVQIEEEETKK